MPKRQFKLSRRETVLAVLAAIVLVAALASLLLLRRQTTAQEELTTQVRRARANLADAERNAITAPLEQQRAQVREALAQAPPARVDGSDVSLKIWGWARDSNVTVSTFDYVPGTAKVGDVALATHEYMLLLSGRAEGLHRFLALATASAYNPAVRVLSLTHVLGDAAWEMRLELVAYAQEAAGN